jgi:hypothetical protein
MSAYQYEYSAPLSFVDPTGMRSTLSNYQSLLLSILEAAHNEHARYTYSEPSGLDKVLFDMRALAGSGRLSVGINSFLTQAAKYYPLSDGIDLNGRSPAKATVFHEMVHAIDDLDGHWYAGSNEQSDIIKAEALAYAAEYIYEKSTNLRLLEDLARSKDKPDCKRIQTLWAGAWKGINSLDKKVQAELVGRTVTRQIEIGDLQDVKRKLGLQLSCSKLKPIYEKMLSRNECPCELTCEFTPKLWAPFK